ncbi:MAG: hypothetical protein HY591_06215 [Candidatus Omnitrophica bacterium]|nr:hypothetical protein [Candidatus Omnitrophota bacterium]
MGLKVKAIIHGLLVLMLSFSFAGCAAPIILAIGAGAVGGYAVSRDTFEGTTAKGQDEIWEAAYRVVSIMGSPEDNDRKRGEMTARINGVNVTVTIMPVNLTTTKLRIKARKWIFPRIGVAQEVYAKIMNQTEE